MKISDVSIECGLLLKTDAVVMTRLERALVALQRVKEEA